MGCAAAGAAAAAAAALVLSLPVSAAAAPAARLRAAFPSSARLGETSSLRLSLAVSPNPSRAPLTSIQLTFPASLGLATSGLGVEQCARPASDFAAVMIPQGRGLAGCPRNAVMGVGAARADIQLGDETIPELARLTMLAGPMTESHMGLVFLVNAQRPFGGMLALRGRVEEDRLVLEVPQIPTNQFDAVITLRRIDFEIGSSTLRYFDRGRRYKPEAIALPTTCPADGFKFSSGLAYADGQTVSASTRAACPPQQRRPRR